MASNDTDPLKDDPRIIKDTTPFPDPKLYFKVFDSEKDEPDSKYREDVLKLYERWEKKYGRKWPENGLNTEDLVWLYEEAYKDESQAQAAAVAAPGGGDVRRRNPAPGAADDAPGAPPRRSVPREKRVLRGDFITDTDDAAAEALAELPADPAVRARAVAEAKRAAADAAWVTDEFESEDYERGNLEALYGAYLWDGEGKPTYMPSEAPKEELGEGSEGWDDFYTSVRPRGVASEEVRDAMWATDEFESDEDNTESEWEPEYVGAGLGLDHEDPLNPQWSLRHSNHPLAPFPGEALKWESYVYDDGTTYEGLTRDAIPHGMGVMMFGHGTGAGFHFRDVRTGDKYEGEFQVGYAHGLGQLTSTTSGDVYIGEFFAGQKHGCGMLINMAPFYWLLERGLDPAAAYQKTYDRIMRDIQFRTWYRNQPLGDGDEDEAVLSVVREDLGNPWDVVTRNSAHEAALRDWGGLTPEQKAVAKMVDILDSVARPGDAFNKYTGGGGRPVRPRDPAIGNDHASGDDSFDSIELQVGNTTEGGYGFGWHDVTHSDVYPEADALAQQIGADVAEDIGEESEDKEAILGDDILNPTTGLSLRDYLDGREREYNELLLRTVGGESGASLVDVTYVDEPPEPEGPGLGLLQRAQLVESLKRFDALYAPDADDPPETRAARRADANPYGMEETDTRFETESDQMELCDLAEILGTVDEARDIVTRARMWRWKPYGEVTLRMAVDARAQPLDLMQDPLHYPHSTKWMAPGPLGQVHPLPDDKSIRLELARAAHNYAHIYSLYNFDWDPAPGSVQHTIDQRVRRAQELQLRRLDRMADALRQEEAGGGGGGGGVQPGQLLASAAPGSAAAAAGGAGAGGGGRGAGGGGGGPAFASVSMSMGAGVGRMGASLGRASRAVLTTMARAAKRAPPRPRLARPQRGQQQQEQRQRVQRSGQRGGGAGAHPQQQQQRQQQPQHRQRQQQQQQQAGA